MIPRAGLAALLACWLVIVAHAPARAAAVLQFDLGAPTLTGSTATLDVFATFTGDPTDTIEAIQLSVLGSDPLLTADGTDFSRFGFTVNTTALPGFIVPPSLPPSGVLLIVADFFGPFLSPSPSPILVGTLSIDLAGLPAGASPTVSLAGGPSGLGTDAFGTVGGMSVDSFAADAGVASVAFTDPEGVELPTAAVPEPRTLTLLGTGAVCLLGRWYRRHRRQGRRPGDRTRHPAEDPSDATGKCAPEIGPGA